MTVKEQKERKALDPRDLELNQLLDLLEKTRKEEGLTQANIAERLKVSRRTYLSWIHNENRPSKTNKKKIIEYTTGAKSREIDRKFEEASGWSIMRLLTVTLPEETWDKLEKLENEKDENVVNKALKEYVEREEVEV